MNIQALKTKLKNLENQKKILEDEILQVKKEIELLSPFSNQDKINLFRELFIAREDIYALYWISKDGLKKGYSPATYTFRGSDYIPVNDDVIKKHLQGKIRIGTYAIINQLFTKFLVLDLDKNSFMQDAKAIKEVCNELELSPLFEISKSGNGIHIWFFFEALVKAVDARSLGDIIITKAMDISDGIKMDSYDRMFPNQDFVSPDMLGNLIAMPLQYNSRKENKTVFIDIYTMEVYPNQWEVLQNAKKISLFYLQKLIQDNIVDTYYHDRVMPWEIKKSSPVRFPKVTKAVLYDSLYIEKIDLSKQLIHKLQRFASFLNPEFYKLQSLRKSTYKTPRVITLFEINERYIVLPRGLTNKIKQYFHDNSSTLVIEDKRVIKKISKQNFTLTLRDEQKNALKSILKNDYSIFIAPPGFGKTAVASAVIAKRGVNTLILLHKTSLLDQWADRLSEYFDVDKKTFGQLGKGKKKLTSNIDIAMLHSLRNRPDLIKEYSQIIIDEVHHIPAISFEIPLRNFRGRYIVGLSATPKRKDGMHPVMYMQCGDIAYEVKNDISKKDNILKIIKTTFKSIEENFTQMLTKMVDDLDRNRLIIDEIKKLNGRNILLISERIDHLNRLHYMLEEQNIKSTLIHGGLKQKIQKEALLKAKDANVILSTSSFIGEGIDFAHLDTIVLTMPVSFDGRMIQYLGRIGRAGQKCLAIDFVDELNPMLKSSFSKREKAYKKMGYLKSNKIENGNLFETI